MALLGITDIDLAALRERFRRTLETRNPDDPQQSAAFMRIEELPSPDVA